MALSTTFTQYASEITKFGKITQNKGHFAVRLPISVQFSQPYVATGHTSAIISRMFVEISML